MNTNETQDYDSPKNQHQQVLWYLIKWKFPFSLTNVINDSMFYKFQTRLSDIELRHGSLTSKETTKFVNRFKRKSHFIIYKCTNIDKAKKLFIEYSK